MVMRLPERDQLSITREKMLADLCVAFGGRIAEEMVFGHDKVTTGAISDIEQATRMARAMVTRFGMSDELGPIAYRARTRKKSSSATASRARRTYPKRRRRRSTPKSAASSTTATAAPIRS